MIVKEFNELIKSCSSVSEIEKEEIIKKLFNQITVENTAIGLSAIQIGINKKIFLAFIDHEWKVFSNVEIVEKMESFIFYDEQCLSFPNVKLNTIRYNKIKFNCDEDKELVYSGLNSVIVQHETDHQNKTLFFDRQVPHKYDKCFCGSNVKFKFCCWNNIK